MNFMAHRMQRGFTLIELLVVITIVGLLASVVMASLANSRIAARDAARVSAVKEFQKALELYRNANSGSYPCATAGCAAGGAAGVVINDGAVNNVNTLIASYFRPATELVMPSIAVTGMLSTTASIVYRVGSTNGSNDNPDRGSYTILLRREQAVGAIPANTWCTISSGTGHSAWTGAYARCY
ncbi:MAG: type II secretion system protein [Patescibacteria group bacterium]